MHTHLLEMVMCVCINAYGFYYHLGVCVSYTVQVREYISTVVAKWIHTHAHYTYKYINLYICIYNGGKLGLLAHFSLRDVTYATGKNSALDAWQCVSPVVGALPI